MEHYDGGLGIRCASTLRRRNIVHVIRNTGNDGCPAEDVLHWLLHHLYRVSWFDHVLHDVQQLDGLSFGSLLSFFVLTRFVVIRAAGHGLDIVFLRVTSERRVCGTDCLSLGPKVIRHMLRFIFIIARFPGPITLHVYVCLTGSQRYSRSRHVNMFYNR